ncbi:MAG: HupE/UreJ family protein [Desulfobacterales bacterium]|nr:HupE/UreJ family protein [Deltaproteobacteria bacterium]NNK93663.1 HupE/UreJ family protein [Desulfobacterales bacterium]
MERGYFFFPILFLVISSILVSTPAFSHESQPGSLTIRQIDNDRYDISYRAPNYYGKRHPAQLQLPEEWKTLGQATERKIGDSIVYHRVISTNQNSIEGKTISFSGIESTITNIFVRLTRLDGTQMSTVANAATPRVTLRGERYWYVTTGEYVALGLHHILLGVDHLLFVLGLLMIVSGGMMLFKTITSFTVAHSITLAIATLGYAQAPLPPLNAAIALSILFLGPEIVRARRGESSLTIRFPWLVAFAFGLLHGFGFASGLSTVGMPGAELPWALLWFNVGVEIGQLLFVFLALALVRSFRILEIRWPRWALALPGYTVGSLGAYWTIQRTALLLGVI